MNGKDVKGGRPENGGQKEGQGRGYARGGGGGGYVGNTEREITRGRLGGEDMTERDGREVFRSVYNMMGI